MPSPLRLDTLNFATQLEAAKNILGEAQPKVTFWGSRVIEVKEDIKEEVLVATHSYSLHDIARRVIQAAARRREADNLTPAERVAGINIVKLLEKLYRITDNEIDNSNFLTKLLVWVREFAFAVIYTPNRYDELTKADHNFRWFSNARFSQEFGKEHLNDPKYTYPREGGNDGVIIRLAQIGAHVA